jgi:hypothetical protein
MKKTAASGFSIRAPVLELELGGKGAFKINHKQSSEFIFC